MGCNQSLQSEPDKAQHKDEEKEEHQEQNDDEAVDEHQVDLQIEIQQQMQAQEKQRRRTVENLQKLQQDLAKSQQQVETRYEQLQKEHTQTCRQYDELEADYAQLMKQQNDNEITIAALQQELSDANDEWSAKYDAKCKEHEALQSEHTQEIKTLRGEIEQLQRTLETNDSASSQEELLRTQYEEKCGEHDQLKVQHQLHTEQLAQSKTTLSELQAKYDALSVQLKDTKASHSARVEQLELIYQSEYEKLLQEFTTYREEQQQQQQKEKEKSEDSINNNEDGEWHTKWKTLNTEHEALQVEVKKLTSANEQLSMYESEYSKLLNEFKEHKQTQQQSDAETLQSEIEKLKQKNTFLQTNSTQMQQIMENEYEKILNEFNAYKEQHPQEQHSE